MQNSRQPLREPGTERLDLLEFQQKNGLDQRAFVCRKAPRAVESVGFVLARLAQQVLPRPQYPCLQRLAANLTTLPDTEANEERQSPQMGMRFAPVSSWSQMRHPAGKNTLTSASLTPVNQRRPAWGQLRAPWRRAKAFVLDELASAMQAEIYYVYIFN
jgi:hypothetical protein